jgi:hypothetical protein
MSSKNISRKQFVLSLIKKHRRQLLHMGVKVIGIFGSVAREEDSGKSDFDILVEFDEKHHKFRYFNELCDFLEHSLGENFDLITRQGLSPYLRDKILQETEYVDLT